MKIFDAYLAFGVDGHYEWSDFVDFYLEACVKDKGLLRQVSLLEFGSSGDEDDFWRDVQSNLEENISDLPLEISQAKDKDHLLKIIISITDYVIKKVLIDHLPDDLRWSLRFQSLTLFPYLSGMIDRYYNLHGQPDFDVYEEYQVKNYLLDYSNQDEITKFIELFSIKDCEIIDKVSAWIFERSSIILSSRRDFFTNNAISLKTDFLDLEFYKTIQKAPDLLRTMEWRLFEEMLADILKYFKYKVELTRKTKDGGIDIIAITNDLQFGNHKYLLQAKRYKNAVEVSPVRELMFLHNEHRATKCCLATTSKFTRGAWELAEQYKWQLELKDQMGILEWINLIIKK